MIERSLLSFFTYMCGYLLLIEWLLPLPEVSSTGYISLFIAVTGFFFLIVFLDFPAWITLPTIGGIILLILHLLFYEETFLSLPWWQVFFEDIFHHLGHMITGTWQETSHSFQSLIFLLLLAMMSYLLYFWIAYAKRILFFFICTVIFIGVLDTFFDYDGSWAMIRVTIIGFLLLLLLQWRRLTSYFPVFDQKKALTRWLVVSVAILGTAIFVASLLPKSGPTWEDPMPYVQEFLGIEDPHRFLKNNEVRRVGYGDDDTQLGGGFEQDDRLVFTAVADREVRYWRGESKNVYTGQGWETNTPLELVQESNLYQSHVEAKRNEVDMYVEKEMRYDFVFYDGSLEQFRVPDEKAEVSIDNYTGKAYKHRNGEPFIAHYYETVSASPVLFEEELRESSEVDPAHIEEYFLQLPEHLSPEVKALAQSLTENEETRYDKVRAIESYFHSPIFTYETENVPVPEEDEDYVEQFLFDTMRGYCDNFSTSMVVLLRSIDIPARWVKGFTSGEKVGSEEGRIVYEVTNGNAHSWVEVYFPSVGWVPFEPTKGFSPESYPSIETEEKEEEEKQEDEIEEMVEEETEGRDNQSSQKVTSWVQLLLFIMPLLLIGILYKYRIPIYKKYLQYRYNRIDDDMKFVKAYLALMTLFKMAGHNRRKSETFREFAKRMDQEYETNDMSLITEQYEQIYYGNKRPSPLSEEIQKSWENIIKRIKS